MPATNRSTEAAPPPLLARLSGYLIGVPAAIIALVSFFLPWMSFVAENTTFAKLSGLQIASGWNILSSEGTELFRGSPVNFLVPIVSGVILLRAVLAFRRKHVNEWDGLGTVALAFITLVIEWGQFIGPSRTAEMEGIVLKFHPGYSLLMLALFVLLGAGIWNTRTAIQRNPAFGATLGAWGFMSPATFLVVLFFFIPAIFLLYLSLTDLASHNFTANPFQWNFIGLDNYRKMFNDPFFPKILGNTFKYVFLTLGFFNVGLALLLALLTTIINRRVSFIFRLLWLLPRITPSVVYIVMWRRFVQTPPYGIINQFLGWIGVDRQPYWLTEQPWLFVVLANGFVGASFGMIIFTSAIEAIPKDLFTAAKVDGASTWQIIRDITLPMLRWPLLFVTSYQTLSLLVSFEYILLLTQGGPGLFTTEVWALTAYKRALFTYFGSHEWGYGAAWGFILVIIGIILAVVYLRVFQFNELVQEPKIDVL